MEDLEKSLDRVPEHMRVRASENYSEGEVRRREEGEVWTPSVNWYNGKIRSNYCPC